MEKKEEGKHDRQRGFGDKRRKGKPQGRERPEERWFPITKLGRLVKGGKITNIEEIYKFALPIKGIYYANYRATNYRPIVHSKR